MRFWSLMRSIIIIAIICQIKKHSNQYECQNYTYIDGLEQSYNETFLKLEVFDILLLFSDVTFLKLDSIYIRVILCLVNDKSNEEYLRNQCMKNFNCILLCILTHFWKFSICMHKLKRSKCISHSCIACLTLKKKQTCLVIFTFQRNRI